MSTGIRQMQLRYDPEQDRLLFILNTQGDEEFHFWFTRRYIKILWPLVQRTLERVHNVAIAPTQDPVQKRAVLSFHHEHAVSQADFKTPYQKKRNASYPLGQLPVLATKASLIPDERQPDIYLFSIHPTAGKGVQIRVDSKLLHAFAKLISDALDKSDWDIKYHLTDTTQTVQSPISKPRILN